MVEMKINPTKLLEEITELRKEQEQAFSELNKELGALKQLESQLKEHFGTSDYTKAKILQDTRTKTLNKLIDQANQLRIKLRKNKHG